jgi:hypothetical protein
MFKIKQSVSKRQIQRRIKKNKIKAQQQIVNDTLQFTSAIPQEYSLFTLSSAQSKLSDGVKRNNQIVTDDETEDISSAEAVSNDLASTSSSNSDFDQITYYCVGNGDLTTDDNNFNNKGNLENQIREWACVHNVTSNALTSLLKILQPHLKQLPIDARTLLRTPRSMDETRTLTNGFMHYFGISKTIMWKLQRGFRNKMTKIKLQINIDGLPLFKSSSTEVYPILGLCQDFVDNSPFMIAIFCGTGKPDPINTFLLDFIDEVKKLKIEGILHKDFQYDFEIACFICDAPARAYLKQTVSHNSKLGCERCNIYGSYDNHCVNFAEDAINDHPKKLESDFYSTCNFAYIKNKTPLTNLNIKFIEQFPLDPMHLLFQGVVRRLLVNYYLEGKRPYKLSHQQLTLINERIGQIKSYIPSEFPRKPRPFKEIKRYKAVEYRLIVMYTGPVILFNVLNNRYYKHFLLLHCAIFILSNQYLIDNFVNEANNFLKDFVVQAGKLFEKAFVVYNVHGLTHLVDDVRNYGSLNDFSCFPFENYLQSIKKKVRSNKNVLQQIYNRVHEFDSLSRLKINRSDDETKAQHIFNSIYSATGETISFNCKKIHTSKYDISTTHPDNCVYLKSNKVVLIKSITYTENEFLFEGVPFKYSKNLYNFPLESSKLGIHYVKHINVNAAVLFKLNDIFNKGILLPHKTGFAVFPLNHIIIH